MEQTPQPLRPLSAAKITGYVLLIALGIVFSFVTIGAFGNALGWLAVIAAIGLVSVPVYGLVTRQRIGQLPLLAKAIFWLGVLSATCFVVLMVLVVFALRNNFS
jgi:hypothetical protein